MMWKELRDFLNGLGEDPRLDDRVLVYDTETGETDPCDTLELDDEDFGPRLVLMVYDWGKMSKIENPIINDC